MVQHDSEPTPKLIRAAQYVRMSTEHQRYSTENQAKVIARYAAEHGMEIVATYADSGKSGLTLRGRAELRKLLAEAESGQADFSVVLVYDVSRWGRFLDTDESAYHEYICRRAGVSVHYPAEQFVNDGSPMSTLIKTVKRTMAAEYSRELSVKVFAGQCHLIEQGYHQGGKAGYGLRRQLVGMDGTPKALLLQGQKKSLQTDRVILVPGSDDEIRVVREIFEVFAKGESTEAQLAQSLNSRGLRTSFSREWTRTGVHSLLTNPKYMGTNVFNRRSFKLKQKRLVNPPDMWIRKADAFEALVTPEQFTQVQKIIQARSTCHLTDAEMLERLHSLLNRYDTLSEVLIDGTQGLPTAKSYRSRFGSLLNAYTLIGFAPEIDYAHLKLDRALRQLHSDHSEALLHKLREAGASVRKDPVTQLFVINEEFSVSLVLAHCRSMISGDKRWNFRLNTSHRPDITIAIRLEQNNKDVLDYYLFPGSDLLAKRLLLRQDNGFFIDLYRFNDLRFLISMAERTQIERAA
jgi:DNA invertase Pin-like site-specific DNA recombinase